MRQPIAIARTAPEIKPKYEKDPVIEKLEIRNTAVSKPSRRIAKKTTKNTPHEESFTASRVFSSRAALSLTFFDSQKITYQISMAVRYKNIASNSAAVESLPMELLARITM